MATSNSVFRAIVTIFNNCQLRKIMLPAIPFHFFLWFHLLGKCGKVNPIFSVQKNAISWSPAAEFLFYRQFLISLMLMKKRQLSAKCFTSFTMASKSRRCLNDPNRFCYTGWSRYNLPEEIL
jgi:hypothetical protein